MKYTVFILLCLGFIFSSCEKLEDEPFKTMGMSPVYIDGEDASLIKSVEARPFGRLGAIVERGDFIYICEIGKGIHVIDNSNPSSPQTIRFWEIPGVSIFTLNATRLYANNSLHLWVIDITDINNIFVIDKEEDIYKDSTVNSSTRPPESYRGYFECVDPEKGIAIDWVIKELDSPKCEAY